MFEDVKVAVVVPAYEEQRLIQATLRGVPALVDVVFVVDDASRDGTQAAAQAVSDPRVRVIRHERNRGVGAAIVTGYRTAVEEGCELVAVMAADNQMDPDDLEPLLRAIVATPADYAKGNRFLHDEVQRMPPGRRVAGRVLSWLTRLATGLTVDDTQCGYAVIRAECLRRLDLDGLWPRYGYPNDLLALLARGQARVVEVPVRPVYADERSGVRAWHAILIAGLLLRRWLEARRVSQR